MADTYTPNTGMLLMAFNAKNWDTKNNANLSFLDSLSTVGSLAVQTAEKPSSSLNVDVAPGSYEKPDGTVGAFAGNASFAVPANATSVVYLTAAGGLTTASSYPATPHVRLATVVAGATTITSIVDGRSPAPLVYPNAALVNAASDAAAAAAGVGVSQYYRNGSAVQIRVS